MLIVMVHNLIRKHAELARSPTHQVRYHQGEIRKLSASIYQDINKSFDYVKNTIELVSNNEIGTHYWSNKPGSWDKIPPRLQPNGCNRNSSLLMTQQPR